MSSKKTLTEIEKRALSRYADTAGAKGYGAWLKKSGTAADEARQAAATAAGRQSYNQKEGERLSALGLSEDGYAAYLRRAAKEAREARTASVEADRAKEAEKALAGYAAYLDGVREQNAERLQSTAEALLNTPHTEKEAAALIGTATGGQRAKSTLMTLYRTRGITEAAAEGNDTAKVVKTISEARMPYERAYEYCRLLGYGEEMAHRIAAFTEKSQNRYTEELWELFGYS
ncbi:MAG: hypothetical protein J6T24_04725 [Clostridia bacterium]|nr:hypothetical protein [Clostridia bacterium]